MGENSSIKRFSATPAGQPIELFESRRSRLPAVAELLASPWIVPASDLMHRDGTSAARHVTEAIDVEWDAEHGRPAVFLRAGRRYCVEVTLQVWATEKSWWDPRRRVSRRYWRVLTRGGVYDLAFDRETGAWQLVGIQD